jgi:hypothetical protein
MHTDDIIILILRLKHLKINSIMLSFEEEKKCYGVSTLPQVSSDGSTATITPLARIPPCRTHISEFTIISLPASANDAGSLKCLPVVRSDWAVQANTQQPE